MKKMFLYLLAALIIITATILLLLFRGLKQETNQGPQVQKVIIERNIKLKDGQ